MDIRILIGLLRPISAMVLLVLGAFALVLGLVLDYHWRNHEIKMENIANVRLFYFGISLVLFCVMVAAFLFAS